MSVEEGTNLRLIFTPQRGIKQPPTDLDTQEIQGPPMVECHKAIPSHDPSIDRRDTFNTSDKVIRVSLIKRIVRWLGVFR